MKLFAILLSLLFMAAMPSRPILLSVGGPSAVSAVASSTSAQDADAPPISDSVIEAGLKIGPIKIGDTQERVMQLFPKKAEDQEWDDACGTTFNWVDTTNRIRGGNVYFRFKKGKVFQIESATTRFHTAEGITSLDKPDKIPEYYKDMRAYTLLTKPTAALGNRPLVFWVDKKRGIAFAFAYYPAEHRRYLYKIIVFAPNKTFCAEEETTNSNKWQEIDPYRLEPPSILSAEPPSN